MPFLLVAQEKQVSNNVLFVDYTHSIQVEGAPSATVIDATLYANQFATLYEMDFLGEKKFISEEDSEEGTVFRIKPKSNDFVYKDFSERTIYSILRISMKPFLVKDSISIFNWKFENDFKEVMGYKCQKATVHYRGRNYVAYFTTEVAFQNGPWKFSNLPGLILEAYATDNVLKIIANRLEIKQGDYKIENPYEKQLATGVSWEEFLVEYEKKFEELRHFRYPGGGTSSLPKKGIEIFIE